MIRDNSDVADYRTLLNTEFNNPAVQPSELHQCIFDLDARIVITTNFDKIYEKYCFQFADGEAFPFKVLPYTATSLADELRSDTRIIIKAHGTIDDIGKMIFTRSEYHKAKADHAHFYEMLKALFLTNMVLFIGCGLNDPDVVLLLEDVKIVGQGECAHYALTLAGLEDKPTIGDWRRTYNVTCLEYEPDHAVMLEDLRNLLTQVEEARRLRS